MTNKINGADTFPTVTTSVDIEFLEALLEPEDGTYPWNPADTESEDYFHQLGQQFALGDLLEEELTTRSQNFYHHLDTLWQGIPNCTYYNRNTKQAIVEHLEKNLHNTFATCVPQTWLKAIAHKAAEFLAQEQLTGEKLVECVQGLLPTWGVEDLLVLARPFAYNMRSGEPERAVSVMSNLQEREWTSLSEIEQAKASLAIAYYALTQLDSFHTEA
jgi:hypothetical protein